MVKKKKKNNSKYKSWNIKENSLNVWIYKVMEELRDKCDLILLYKNVKPFYNPN